jgi:hypothetical protein
MLPGVHHHSDVDIGIGADAIVDFPSALDLGGLENFSTVGVF